MGRRRLRSADFPVDELDEDFEDISEDEFEDIPQGAGHTKVDEDPPKEFELDVDSGELKLDTDFELLDLEDLELE